jgi:isopentenyldiphosphate isomerase
MLPVFNPQSGKFLFHEKRHLVHTQGHWHKGIQANVIREEGNSFEILMQVRSDTVDIGKKKFDQSLATQMTIEDILSEENALHRGLQEELGISSYKKRVKMQGNIRIIKTYEDDWSKFNCEMLSLYILEVAPDALIKAHSPKIQSLEWVAWKDFLKRIDTNPTLFTKTAQFYFRTKEIRKEIELLSMQLIQEKLTGKISRLKNKSYLHIHYRNTKPKTYSFTKNSKSRKMLALDD